jgi:hypothetical protein
MAETYYDDEDGILRGKCAVHGEFVGDAIGCPQCFADSENAEANSDEELTAVESADRTGYDLNKEVYISTGRKSVMYTLWQVSIGQYGRRDQFVKNLSLEKSKAILEARKWALDNHKIYTGIDVEPKNSRADFFEFAGVHFTRKNSKNGSVLYFGKITSEHSQEFWNVWREQKDELKSKGFSVSKYVADHRHPENYVWYAFYKGVKPESKTCPECVGYQETIDNGDEVCTTCQTCGREWEYGT